MKVTLQIDPKFAALDAQELGRFANRAHKAVKLRGGAAVMITTSAQMKQMNRWFRHKNKPTDVLSFIADGIRGYAGDIAISADIAKANANSYGHSVADEIKILILHGMLHLAGHDHETDNGLMARKEDAIREKLGLPGSLIERSSFERAKSPATRKPASRARCSTPRPAVLAKAAAAAR